MGRRGGFVFSSVASQQNAPGGLSARGVHDLPVAFPRVLRLPPSPDCLIGGSKIACRCVNLFLHLPPDASWDGLCKDQQYRRWLTDTAKSIKSWILKDFKVPQEIKVPKMTTGPAGEDMWHLLGAFLKTTREKQHALISKLILNTKIYSKTD